MKKAICVGISFLLIVSLLSCSNVYEETIITDANEYDKIWTLPERRISGTSTLFPESIDKEQCISLLCRHTTYQIVGTGWQVSLVIKYDDTLFSAELERLKNNSLNSPIYGHSEYFDDPAYATVWNWNSCFEYAVVDEKEKSVCYIYLQLIEKNDLIIDNSYIPVGYEMELPNSNMFSAYEK